MSVLMEEKEFKKKEKKFTILGVLLLILGFGCFIAGPVVAITTNKPYLFVISFAGPLMFVPGFILLSLGTSRKMVAYQAQAVGPVSVEASQKYGRKVAKEMAAGAMEGLNEEKQIFCKYCGQEIDSDSDFCKYCGKKLN